MSDMIQCERCGKAFVIPSGSDIDICPACCIKAKEPEPEDTRSREIIAFVQGAKWWEWETAGATMFSSDRNMAEAEAMRLADDGKLGVMRELKL